MSKDILGIYGSKRMGGGRKGAAQAHTPDPTKYHDASQERLEGESAAGATVLNKLPGNHGFNKLRGVIIPSSTPLGGSRGHNHLKPQIIHIDPGPYGEGGIVVDLAHLTPESVADAVEASASTSDDIEDIAINAFAALSRNGAGHNGARVREDRYEEERLPPLQMPDTYVVPKASPGGGQQVKRASFTQRPPVQESRESVRASSPSRQPASLNDELTGDSWRAPISPLPPAAEPVKVTVEVPGGHQFHVGYHDVVRQGMTLVLVYDYDRPFQMVYFPPVMEDADGEPVGMAILVHARKGEKSILYRVQSPGIQFKHRNMEYCVLLIEKEKEYTSEDR